jgi:phosphopantetheinyl transferase
LYYDEFGKPHLNSDKHISISHSHNFAAVIISDKTVGIDLEWAREKIIRIADKFASGEMHFLLPENKQDYIEKLTVIWGVKESIFKIRNEPGISFKHHITVLPFEMEDQEAVGQLHFGTSNVDFDIHFLIIEDFVLVYAFESAHK